MVIKKNSSNHKSITASPKCLSESETIDESKQLPKKKEK